MKSLPSVRMSWAFRLRLRLKVSKAVVGAISKCMNSAHSTGSEFAFLYAKHIEASYALCGLEGLKRQTLGLVSNLVRWETPDAREAKRVVCKWVYED